jgi:hypothetical protein
VVEAGVEGNLDGDVGALYGGGVAGGAWTGVLLLLRRRDAMRGYALVYMVGRSLSVAGWEGEVLYGVPLCQTRSLR